MENKKPLARELLRLEMSTEAAMPSITVQNRIAELKSIIFGLSTSYNYTRKSIRIMGHAEAICSYDGKRISVSVTELSKEGFCLIGDDLRKCKVNDALSLETIIFDEDETNLNLECRIVHCKLKDDTSKVGVEILDKNDVVLRDKFAKDVYNKFYFGYLKLLVD